MEKFFKHTFIMEQLNEILNRFRQLSFYDTKRIIAEGEKTDTTGYVCVGEVPYDPWLKGIDKLYVMVSPHKIMRLGKETYDVIYTENSDGSGGQTDNIPTYAQRKITIYPEHEDDEYGEIFLGKKKSDETSKLQHKEFISKLFTIDDKVIIHHNSSSIIKDGFIRKGKPNGWSNNSDIGTYFWGSRNDGNDPSNNSSYTYYCIIHQDSIYDFHTNAKRMSLDNAIRRYDYVGQMWNHGGDAVVISTLRPTPIWRILDKQTGIWYDKNWNEVDKPF